jgi:hypothetical protein
LSARTRSGPVRSPTLPANAYAGHPDALQDRLKLGTVVPLTSGDQEGEWLLSESVIGGLDCDSAGFIPLQVPFPRAPAAC